ncbi:MAG: AAA family ATPase [Gemmatimonadales bacterium]|nr:AAA family ATPase [Gemmatimonadales bacterium]MYG50765.1 AAA family ATPase [Gemmatimonadales bacterium]MYK03173.1 AAA family ATPase [Candidatus Palauibacter ramosifaciens]
MRFESVTAHRFGPFRDETLELAPGMNVVFGRNEAGKSSWHAALYAGLCGIRRGKGAIRKEERRFAERHRPWDGDEWEIGAIVALEDGRRVELRHDLAGRVESSAEDTSVARRDYSGEILFDGAPDGSRWLGLNRRSFLATACVRQADILKVRDDPESLQEDMQRAAATAGVDQTAAAALQRLEEVLRERVGSTRAPTKPLMTTARRVAESREALEAAREAQRDFQERRAEVETLEQAARDARRRVEAAAAALASAEAEALAERLREARALHEEFPEGAPHPVPEGGGLTRAVTEALTTWRNLPAPVELTGPSAREIGARIEGVDTELAAARAVIAEAAAADAEARLASVHELHALFPDGGPRVSPEEDARMGEIRDALRAWESLPAVEAPIGRSVEELEEELANLEERRRAPLTEGPAARPAMWLALSAVVAAGGLVLALLAPDSGSAGLILFAVGAAGVLSHRFARTRSDRSEIALALDVRHDSLRRELASARAEHERYEDGRRHRREAIGRMRELADPETAATADPETLADALRREVASLQAGREKAGQLGSQWDELKGLLAGSSFDALVAETDRRREAADVLVADVAEAALADARARGITRGELDELERRAAERRRTWSDERARRLAAETRDAQRSERAADAANKLREAGAQVGVTAEDPEDLAAALEQWRAGRERVLDEAGERNESWDRLQQLLGERTLEAFADDVERLRLRAARLLARSGADVDEARARRVTEATLEDLKGEAEAAREEVLRAGGQLTEREHHLPSVADAEDALAAAEREQARIARLKDTLDCTIGFLEEAQERVLRDIAPILRRTVLEWLPGVTDGRYTGCRIDPENLLVEVRAPGGRWRPAELLSHGTAEQIYLLLRFALSRHLTREGESCPLILDDVVAASDAARKRAVLQTLYALSRSTQIILFTHEDDVRDWATDHLAEPDGRLIELGGRRVESEGNGLAAAT